MFDWKFIQLLLLNWGIRFVDDKDSSLMMDLLGVILMNSMPPCLAFMREFHFLEIGPASHVFFTQRKKV